MRPHRSLRLALPAACAALTTVGARQAHAYRPFDGTDAEVADFGELEIELGTAYTVSSVSPMVLSVPALVVNVGIWPRIEAVLETNNQLGRIDGGKGTDQIADTHLFAKFVLRKGFAQEGTGPSIALEAGPWLPNPNGEVGIGGSACLIVSFETGPMVFDVNVQGNYDLEHHPELFGSVILEGSRSFPMRPVTEIAVTRVFGGATTFSALAGGIWKARKAADIDFGVEALSTDGVPMGRLRIGLTWRAPLWKAKE